MEVVQFASISLEAIVGLLCVLIGAVGKRWYGWALALTFAIYVYYDAARLWGWETSPVILQSAFLVATLSALVAVWGIYKER